MGFRHGHRVRSIPRGLSEDVVRLISAKKHEPDWLLEWRLKAFRHWQTMTEPAWANVHYPKIDYKTSFITPLRKRRATAPRASTTSTRNC